MLGQVSEGIIMSKYLQLFCLKNNSSILKKKKKNQSEK